MSNFTKATIKVTDKGRLLDLQNELMKSAGYRVWIGEATAITWLLDLADTVKAQAGYPTTSKKETNNDH